MASRTEDITFTITFNDKGSAKLKRILKDTETSLKKTDAVTKKSNDTSKKQEDQTKKTSTAMSGFKKMLSSTWGQMALGMGVMGGLQQGMRAVVNAVKSLINSGREFERSWANVRTMLDETVVNHEKMRSSLLMMSPALGDATELAKGMYQVLSASVAPAKAMKVLEISAMSAKAGVTQVAVAVDAITTVLNAYGMRAEEAGNVSDIMFQTVKRGKLTFEQMATSIGTVATIAAQVGIRFEEIAGAVATMTKKGIDASTATMQLRQTLVAVLKPTKEAQETAKRLGIDFSATALKAKGLSGFLKDISVKTKGNVEDMTMLFGNVRALTGVMALAGTSSESFATDVKKMGEAAGSTKEAFKKQMESMDAQIAYFSGSVKKFGQAFYIGFVENFKKSTKHIELWDMKVALATKRSQEFGTALGFVAKGFKDTFDMIVMGKVPFMDDREMKKMLEAMYEAKQEYESANRWVDRFANNTTKAMNAVGSTVKAVWDKFVDQNKRAADSSIEVMEILEELEYKSKKTAETGIAILTEQFNKLSQSGMVTIGTLEDMAKKIVKAHQDMGTQASVHIRALAGEYEALLEGTDALTIELDASATVLRGKFIPVFTESGGAIQSFVAGMGKGLKYMKEVADAAARAGVVIKSQLQKELKQTISDFTTLSKAQELTTESTKETVEKIVNYYKRLNKDVPWIYQVMMKKATKDYEDGLKKQGKGLNLFVEKNKKELEHLGSLFMLLGDDISGAFGSIFSNIGMGISTFTEVLTDKTKNWKDALGAIAPMLGNIGSALGGMIGGAKEGEKTFGALGSALGSTIGGMFGPLGKAIGSLAGGLLGGLFGKKEKETLEQKMEREFDALVASTGEALKEFGKISEATAEAIALDRKEMSGFLAVSKNFAEVIRDVGVNQENVNTLWDRTTDIIFHVKDGLLDASIGADALGDSFIAMREEAEKAGVNASEGMLKFIKTLRESGIEVAAVSEYILEQLMRLPDALATFTGNIFKTPQKYYTEYDKYLKANKDSELKFSDWLQEEHKDRWNEIGKQLDNAALLAGSTFEAMIAEGMSYMDAIKAMKDPLIDLIKKYDELGMTIPEALKPMEAMVRLMNEKPQIIENLDASITMLDAFRNSAYLTQETFDVLAQSVAKFAKEILNVEGNLNDAMKTMELTDIQINQLLPMISQFVGAAAMFGLNVPSWMKSFVTEQLDMDFGEFREIAKTQANAGIATVDQLKRIVEQNIIQRDLDKWLQDRADTGLDVLAGKFAKSIWGLKNDLVDAIGGVTIAIGNTAPYTGKPGEESIGAQSGFQGFVRKQEQPFVAHRGEFVSVTPASQVASKGLDQQNITVVIEPVAIDKGNEAVINFIVKKIQRGDVQVPITSVRG